MEMKDIIGWGVLFCIAAGWIASSLVTWRKEELRSREQQVILEAFIRKQNSNETLLANTLGVLAARSTIVIFHDDEGNVIVRSVQTIDPELVKKLVDREVAREEQKIKTVTQ